MTEPARHRLHDGLKEAIGDDNAGTLMQMLPPYSWDEIAKRSDLEAMATKFEGKIDALDTKFCGKIDALETKFEGKIDALETKFEGKVDALDTKFEGKIDALFAKIVLANVGMTVSICGLLFAVIKLGA